MAGRHQGNTKEFRDLPFAEQAKSIAAALNNLQAAIEHHIAHSPRRQATIDKCLAQLDRLRQRLLTAYAQRDVPTAPDDAPARTSPARMPATLEQLLEGVDDSNIHHEFDTGAAVGEEVW